MTKPAKEKRCHPRYLSAKEARLLPFSTGIRVVMDETMAPEFYGVRFSDMDVESLGTFPGGRRVYKVTSDAGACQIIVTKTGRMRVTPLDEPTKKASVAAFTRKPIWAK